jgi:hypothetical protein
MPEIALPTINILELTETPHIREPSSKTARKERKTIWSFMLAFDHHNAFGYNSSCWEGLRRIPCCGNECIFSPKGAALSSYDS